MIKRKGNEWCVYTRDGSKELGCHPTEAEANAQLRAIEASKHATSDWLDKRYVSAAAAKGLWDKVSKSPHPHAACVELMNGKIDDPHAFCAAVEKAAAGTTPAERAAMKKHDYADLNNVEIFAAGKHNGDVYSAKDLDSMVAAFGELDFEPAVKLGHDDSPGAPAYGYVKNLRRHGEKLVADFTGLSAELLNRIKNKEYNRVSAEIYWGLERAGKKFSRALKAVALLGAAVPGVSGLKPLAELFADNTGEVRNYDTELGLEEEGDDVDVAVCDYMNMGSGSYKDLWRKWGSLAKCEQSISGKVKDPKAFGAWILHGATGQWPVEAHPSGEAWSAVVNDAQFQENDMDVKELEARIAKFEAQQAASDSARQAAETKAAEAEHARRDAQAKYEAAEVARKAAEEETKKHSTEAAERIAKLEADKRANEIEKLADSCKIPALRGFVKQFAELGHAAGGVKLYDAEKKEQTPQAAVESFIKYANENAAKLFKVVSSHEEIIPEDDNPAAEVDKRVKEFMAKNAGKNYTEARTAVLAADPDLKERYAAPRVA